MPFHNSERRERKEIFPGILARTFWGEKLLLSLVDLEANAQLPTHSHPQEQCSFVMEGELEFNLGGEIRLVKPGDIVVIPGGMEHSVKVGAKPAKVLDVFSPIREDMKY